MPLGRVPLGRLLLVQPAHAAFRQPLRRGVVGGAEPVIGGAYEQPGLQPLAPAEPLARHVAGGAQIEAAARTGATVIELHTGAYAEAAAEAAAAELARIREAVAEGLRQGLRVNAGHGLHYENVQPVAALEGIAELNIGHAIIAQAVFCGLETAVRDMKALMIAARSKAQQGATSRPVR